MYILYVLLFCLWQKQTCLKTIFSMIPGMAYIISNYNLKGIETNIDNF